jgi:hypothetical protein
MAAGLQMFRLGVHHIIWPCLIDLFWRSPENKQSSPFQVDNLLLLPPPYFCLVSRLVSMKVPFSVVCVQNWDTVMSTLENLLFNSELKKAVQALFTEGFEKELKKVSSRICLICITVKGRNFVNNSMTLFGVALYLSVD